MGEFVKGMHTGAWAVLVCGFIGGSVVTGVAALLGASLAVPAAVGTGLCSLFGAAIGAVTTGTSPSSGDWRGNWAAGLPLTAALTYGAYSIFAPSAPQNEPPKNPPAISMSFNQAQEKQPEVVVWSHASYGYAAARAGQPQR